MKQNRVCTSCGKRFRPRLEYQKRCYECIMESEPRKPSNRTASTESVSFQEWFIYRWNRIREAAIAAGAKPQPEAQDRKCKAGKRKRRGKSVRQMAIERGIEPSKVYTRLRRGWSLEKALEE